MKSPVQDKLLPLVKKYPGLTLWQLAEKYYRTDGHMLFGPKRLQVAKLSRQFILAAKRLVRKEQIVITGKHLNRNTYAKNPVHYAKRKGWTDKKRLPYWWARKSIKPLSLM